MTAQGFLRLQRAGLLPGAEGASHHSGPHCGAQALRPVSSVVVAPGLLSTGSVIVAGTRAARSLSSCDLPGLGTESTSPALAGGFFTAEPPVVWCKQLFFLCRERAPVLRRQPPLALQFCVGDILTAVADNAWMKGVGESLLSGVTQGQTRAC